MDDFSQSIAAASLVDGQHFTLPGCGTLEGVYVSARIDHLAKAVKPPSLEIRWTSVVDDDAQTFAELLEHTGATSAEASELQTAWLDTLAEGESIEIGDLGILELDDRTQLIGFTPHEAALEKAYWGGGEVRIEPLGNRTSQSPPVTPIVPDNTSTPTPAVASTPQASAPVVTATTAPPARKRKRFLDGSVVLAVGALVGIVALLFYLGLPQDEASVDGGKAVPVRHERLNRSPRDVSETAAGALQPADAGEDEAAATFGQSNAEDLPTPDAAVGAPTLSEQSAPDAPQAFDPASLAGANAEVPNGEFEAVEIDVVIIVGSFGQPENAARLTEQLTTEGYLPYVDRTPGYTRVGVTFGAKSEREVAEMLQELRSTYTADAWVLE